jgi:hypothetical protein
MRRRRAIHKEALLHSEPNRRLSTARILVDKLTLVGLFPQQMHFVKVSPTECVRFADDGPLLLPPPAYKVQSSGSVYQTVRLVSRRVTATDRFRLVSPEALSKLYMTSYPNVVGRVLAHLHSTKLFLRNNHTPDPVAAA